MARPAIRHPLSGFSLMASAIFSATQLEHAHLSIDQWHIVRGDAWCVLGRNGSGKQYIDQLLLNTLENYSCSSVERALAEDQIRLVSFEAQQAIYENELRLAATDLLPEEETATRARDFLPEAEWHNTLIDTLGLRHRLDRQYRQLSTGESRKLLVAQAILEGAELLILDNPFDSLDGEACGHLSNALEAALELGITLVLLLSNRQDIPHWCQSFAAVKEGHFLLLGTREQGQIDEAVDAVFAAENREQPDWPDSLSGLNDYKHDHLVELRHCNVSFGGVQIIQNLSLKVAPLQHTLVTGGNGSGKSTLLGLITGDCPQCYSNDISVLGYTRGSGESVWDIKRDIGLVSNDLHRRYRVQCTTLAAVCSGFFDSIGIYDAVGEQQQDIAEQWLAAAGLAGRSKDRFQALSYGEQRLVLIARALVKSPLLLILDEPTQGLDEINRLRVMNLLETLNQRQHTTVIYVSHRRDEHLPLFTQHLHLEQAQTT